MYIGSRVPSRCSDSVRLVSFFKMASDVDPKATTADAAKKGKSVPNTIVTMPWNARQDALYRKVCQEVRVLHEEVWHQVIEKHLTDEDFFISMPG